MNEAKMKQRHIETVLTPALIEALRVAPDHLTFRSQVHAQLRVPVPDDKVTYEQIRDWIECEWQSPTPPPPQFVTFRCTYSENAYGHCRYQAARHGDKHYQLTHAELMVLLDQAIAEGDRLGDFWTRLNDYMQSIVDDDMPNLEIDPDTITTSRYDIDETDEHDYDYGNLTMLRQKVQEYLRKHRPVDTETLENNRLAPPPFDIQPRPPQPPEPDPDDNGDDDDDNGDDEDNGEETE